MEMNEVLQKLPKHLLNLVIDQPYNEYTAQDHAVWRFVMRQNVHYLPKVAHHSYIDGLAQAGIGIDSIPNMCEMNRILRKMGWAAVAVDGFIPPAAFMEFQAYRVLVIASDIRPVNQIEYTPAPDIIHEAAGHAPIIADPDYAEYLRLFGEIGSRAFSSAHNYKVYDAIRHLSILKADPYSTPSVIQNAEENLSHLLVDVNPDSEMTRIRNLHWWTVEYGLIGDLDKPKIYGAGLLSSIGESYSSLQPEVKKIPYSIKASRQSFDITARQPQLFVTPTFCHLVDVLNEFADGMALRRGGLYGVKQAIRSGNYGTCVYNSGLQVSGIFTDLIEINDDVAYIITSGKTALAFDNQQLDGHGKSYHAQGFGSPVGKVKGINQPLYTLNKDQLKKKGIEAGQNTEIEYESGIRIKGTIKKLTFYKDNLILISWTDCIVRYNDRILFEPEWGIYDMAVGEEIISAFSGIADPDAFEFACIPPTEKTHKIAHTEEAKQLYALYQRVRDIRGEEKNISELSTILRTLKSNFPEDWLLPMEIYELAVAHQLDDLMQQSREYLEHLKGIKPELERMINNGFETVHK